MKLSKYRILMTIVILFAMSHQQIMSQIKGVIIDKETKQPIPYLSIYSTDGKNVLGATTDENGQFSILFPFQSLVLTHINYEKREIMKEDIEDTIFMVPSTLMLQEVVVSNIKPEWIYRILKEVEKQKIFNYQTIENPFSYNYETYTLSDSNGYAFKSDGNLVCPKQEKDANYLIDAKKNVIRYKDKTAGVDFSNMQRMLYDDFITQFDKKFINNNTFNQNTSYINQNKNLVQLMFKSIKYQDSEGYIVIDTLNKVILEAENKSGTEYNIKEHTSALLRNAAAARGFRYNTWIVFTYVKYSKIKDSYFISDSRYKFYMQTTFRDKKYFNSIESKLRLDSNIKIASTKFLSFPKPYYIVAVKSKQMKISENAINNIVKDFSDF